VVGNLVVGNLVVGILTVDVAIALLYLMV
jgi:hypothetical protein